ncbi:lamin-L(III) [Zootoca vivipara]|uniref:lamin-L(III) n=1 Tax=Zootoca vivipara TaxID=8524 RepID=UPI00293B8C7F|nr:lamin-L(III) [Zootoca vivipara]XP_060126427.1 lamin-L(III) [Zootoca vivipara]XP_060126428.1 lamin-L(III) [Zootoca vivipara]XP_060126429.1 lamin-L(III) [Zootoca vivipara]
MSESIPTVQQQQELLRQFNERLAIYLERVRSLEASNRLLRWCEEDSRAQLSRVRSDYAKELAAERENLNRQVLQRATLQVELESLQKEHSLLVSRNSKNENELSLADARVNGLNAQLHYKEGELMTSLSREQSLQNDLQESEHEIASLKVMVNDSKSQLHNEMLNRKYAEMKVETLQKKVAFQKTLHEEAIKYKNKFHEDKIREMQSQHQQEENKLLNAYKELRKEHEQDILAYKNQMEQNLGAKMEELRISAARSSVMTNVAQEEFREAKMRVESLVSQIAALEARNGDLQAKIRTLEDTILDKQGSSERLLADKNREIAEMQQRMQVQQEVYMQQLDPRFSLNMEIRASLAMLEREEERLRVPRPGSESVGTLASTSLDSPLLPRRRRRMQAGEEPERQVRSVCFKMVQHASYSGSISIEDIDKEGQFVKIRNNSDEEQSLSGWTARRQHGNQSDIPVMYEFPAQCTLGAGQSLTIWGVPESSSPAPGMLVWNSPESMRGGEGIKIILLDSAGDQVVEGKLTYEERGDDREDERGDDREDERGGDGEDERGGDGDMEVAAGEEGMEFPTQ